MGNASRSWGAVRPRGSGALPASGTPLVVAHCTLPTCFGIWPLTTAVIDWLNGRAIRWLWVLLLVGTLLLVDGGWLTNSVGLS